MPSVDVTRLDAVLSRDPARVITKPFLPGEETFPDGHSRVELVLKRVLAMSDEKVADTLASVTKRYERRHRGFSKTLAQNFCHVAARYEWISDLCEPRRLLIGAYFTHEFSFESAALFNPSIVPSPHQLDAAEGAVRVIMSLRAVGEGHISSIEFRAGTIDDHGEVRLDPASCYATTGRRRSPVYDNVLFREKLRELGAENEVTTEVVGRLPRGFMMEDLEESIASLDSDRFDSALRFETIRLIHLLAHSNYVLAFPHDTSVSERVIFPSGPYESHGMEDARFVRFVDEDRAVTYFATYTAWDGFQIIPQLIETKDFRGFRIATMNGAAVQNKGMAMFPRRIDGHYVMLSRVDRENIDLMMSLNVREWQTSCRIRVPSQPWELIQIGNCGSPMETEAGWLVLTHGVGPLREYCVGALLLDLDDPAQVIGSLSEPLIRPTEEEREGYVPNVVYSCGGIIHGEWLFVPYGCSDMATRIARVRTDELLSALLAGGRTGDG